jgi:hypothetical protein
MVERVFFLNLLSLVCGSKRNPRQLFKIDFHIRD